MRTVSSIVGSFLAVRRACPVRRRDWWWHGPPALGVFGQMRRAEAAAVRGALAAADGSVLAVRVDPFAQVRLVVGHALVQPGAQGLDVVGVLLGMAACVPAEEGVVGLAGDLR